MTFLKRTSYRGPVTPASYHPRWWYDASYAPSLYSATSGGTLVTADAANVKRWEDRSGNGFHLTDATGVVLKKAIYGGSDTLRFSGSVRMVNAAATIGLGTCTLVVVYRETTSKVAAGIMSIGSSGSGNDYDVTNRLSLNTYQSPQCFGIQRNFVTTGGVNYLEDGAKPGQLRVRIVTFNQGLVRSWVNGGTASYRVYDPVAITSAAGIVIGDRWISSAFSGSTYGLVGDVCEVIAYPQCLSALDIFHLNRHLEAKWDACYLPRTALTRDAAAMDAVLSLVQDQTIFTLPNQTDAASMDVLAGLVNDQTIFILPNQTDTASMAAEGSVTNTLTIEAAPLATDAAAMGTTMSLTCA